MTNNPTPPTVTYWAISVANSKTMLANGVVGLTALLTLALPLLALPEVSAFVATFPPRVLVAFVAFMAMANLYIRTQTTRPVAFIRPGTTAPVAVTKLDPPTPALVTD
jgi:hypothetical protein